jgi:hypothetical protein
MMPALLAVLSKLDGLARFLAPLYRHPTRAICAANVERPDSGLVGPLEVVSGGMRFEAWFRQGTQATDRGPCAEGLRAEFRALPASSKAFVRAFGSLARASSLDVGVLGEPHARSLAVG